MKNRYMFIWKTLCKINDLKKYSGVLHLVGCLSHREGKLITFRWKSYKGRIHAFVDSSAFQQLKIIRQLSFVFWL